MKIIFLNAFEGKIDGIKQFIQDQSADTDIFCFQESLDKSISKIFCLDELINYQHFFDTKQVNPTDLFANATFIKSNYLVSNSHTIAKDDLDVGMGLYTQIKVSDNKILNICNTHGNARPGDKQDNSARLRQSQNIIDFFKDLSGPKIIGGDFNLDYNTKSVQMFEANGYVNLIKKFNIPTTRNKIAWDQFKNKQLYADFIFVSPDVKITNFSVPNLLISDHLPMILEIEI
jgi:endonuclease/exonuclease/phosphatase family metal-dependent hydrolase